MKHLKSRFLVLGLSVCMIASIIPATAFAADNPVPGTITYTEPIAPQFEAAGEFSNGLAPVKKDGKWGFIDEKGKTVIPFSYDFASYFSEGYAVVGNIKEVTETYGEGEPSTFKAMYLGFINPANKFTEFSAIEPYSEGVYRPMYVTAEYFDTSESLFFHNGYMLFDSNLYATNGKQLNTAFYAETPFNEGLAFGTDDQGNSGFFDATGKAVLSWGEDDYEYYGPVISSEYGYTSQSHSYKGSARSFNQGLAPVWVNNYDAQTETTTSKLGFIDKNGAWVIAPQYTAYYYGGVNTVQRLFGETGLAMVANSDKLYGAVDKSGKTVIPFQYEELWPFYEGVAPFMSNGKYGYIDANTKVVISAKYENASSFNNGYAVVYDGTKAFLINKDGAAIPGADKLDPASYFKKKDKGANIVVTPGEFVVLNKDGKFGYGKIEYTTPLPKASEMNTWAFEEVTGAIKENLVPASLQNLYLNNINRSEFCSLVMQAVTEVKDKTIEELVKTATGKELYTLQAERPFNDISSSSIIATHALGIVNGRGAGTFDPYATITRQEAAGFLMRAAKVLGADMTKTSSTDFADAGYVDVWFKDAVNFVHAINVMSGTGDNAFSPFGAYTREQSYVTIYRLFKSITAK